MKLSNTLELMIAKRRWLKRFVPLQGRTVYVKLPQGRRIFTDASDWQGPSFHVMYGGAKSFETYEKLEKDLILKSLPENGVFLDVGANIGLFSLYVHWHRPQARIHAFEPHPTNFRCLEKSCQVNGISQITPHALAVGDAIGQLSLHFNELDSGGHSAYRDAVPPSHCENSALTVPLLTLDEMTRIERLEKLDVIKIDVQGGEAAVLRGAIQSLKKFRPSLLIECDYRPLLEGEAGGSVKEALEAAGINFYRIQPLTPSELGAPMSLSDFEAHARREFESGKLQGNYWFTARG